MEPLTLLGLLGASIAAASGVGAMTARRSRVKHLDVWWEAARASGATAIETEWGFDRWVMKGWWGKLHFKIEEPRRDHPCRRVRP
jgi:hypothetical protein